MPSFSCSNCSVIFLSGQAQRDHYTSDWHRYNLKRRVAGLPSVDAEEFQSRVLLQRNSKNAPSEHEQFYCNICQKHFKTDKSYANHLNSKKHKDIRKQHDLPKSESLENSMIWTNKSHPRLKTSSFDKGAKFSGKLQIESEDNDNYEDMDEETVDSEELSENLRNSLTEKDCLFCSFESEDLVTNLKHMSIKHSFFIPDIEYCIDLEGLINCLGVKVSTYFMCLRCNERGKMFHSLDAVQKHMIDKGHCQMNQEGCALVEYADYYDYSSSYPDNNDDVDIDEEVMPEILDGDEYSLVLPSGAIIGHRSLLRYYKQRLNPKQTIVSKKSNCMLNKIVKQYRSVGWTQTELRAAVRRARDIHVMKRIQAKWQMKMGCNANKQQHHFRQQVIF